MSTFIVIEVPDGGPVPRTLPGRELCRADCLADLMNAIEDAEVRAFREKRDRAARDRAAAQAALDRAAGLVVSDQPTVIG